MVSKNAWFALLLAILLIGGLLRFYRLSDFPPSLNWDEVSHAYNAYSLLHTGRDQWGQVLPVISFRAYGDYPTPLNLYFTVPSIAAFGPTDFAARFPHALIGTLLIPVVFVATYKWRRNVFLAVLAALFVSLDPWLLFTSRTVLQSNWAVFLLGLALCYYFARKVPTAILFWTFSLFAYHNTRIFVPLLLTTIAIASKKYLLLIGSVILLAGFILLSPTSRARGLWVGVINPGAVANIEFQRNHSSLPPFLSKLVYNRPVFLLTHVFNNYIGYFSPQFLFFNGGTQYQYSLPKFGLLPPINLPFFYLGLILLIPSAPLLLIWLLLSPLPAAITQDQFAVVRATTMLPIVQLITAFGFIWFFSRVSIRWRTLFTVVYLLLIAIWMGVYFHNYSVSYPRVYSSSWQYGYSQVISFLKTYYSQYDEIIFTKKYGEPHEFLAYYWPWDPADFQKKVVWDYHDNWYWVNSLGKIKFINDWEIKHLAIKPNTLVISSPESEIPGREIKRINFLDGQPAFVLYEK